MITITIEQLRHICPLAPKNADAFITYLNKCFAQYSIDTPMRAAMFMAQCAHESGQFRYTQELASGKAYEGRKDLGNYTEGDGVKYKGRGWLMITGRFNYKHCSDALFGDNTLIVTPSLLETPQYAVMSAGWYWLVNKLNDYCDVDDFEGLTKRINGGLNGLVSRQLFFERAKQVFIPIA